MIIRLLIIIIMYWRDALTRLGFTDGVHLHATGMFILITTSDNESQQQAPDYASTHSLPDQALRDAACR